MIASVGDKQVAITVSNMIFREVHQGAGASAVCIAWGFAWTAGVNRPSVVDIPPEYS